MDLGADSVCVCSCGDLFLDDGCLQTGDIRRVYAAGHGRAGSSCALLADGMPAISPVYAESLVTLRLRFQVIQAVTTYKSLVGFVSTTLLSRLITKKIWTNPPLWEGFIRCAKAIAPASFSALLQLPKEQLKELVEKQPSLKSGLKDFVTKKSGNKARAMASLVDIFGPDAEEGVLETTTPPVPASPMMEDTPA